MLKDMLQGSMSKKKGKLLPGLKDDRLFSSYSDITTLRKQDVNKYQKEINQRSNSHTQKPRMANCKHSQCDRACTAREIRKRNSMNNLADVNKTSTCNHDCNKVTASKCVCFETRASRDFLSVRSSMTKSESDVDDDAHGKRNFKPITKLIYPNENIPKVPIDPTKPCKFSEILEAELINFKSLNAKTDPQCSEFWLCSRNSDDDQKDPIILPGTQELPNIGQQKTKNFRRQVRRWNTILTCRSFEYENNRNTELNKIIEVNDEPELTTTISEQTKTLLERSRLLNKLMKYTKPTPVHNLSNNNQNSTVLSSTKKRDLNEYLNRTNRQLSGKLFTKRKNENFNNKENPNIMNKSELNKNFHNIKTDSKDKTILDGRKITSAHFDRFKGSAESENSIKTKQGVSSRPQSADFSINPCNFDNRHKNVWGIKKPNVLRKSSSVGCLNEKFYPVVTCKQDI